MNPWPKDMELAGALLRRSLLQAQPEEAQAMLGGFLGTATGQIPEEFWNKMVASAEEPCGLPGCNCETVRRPMMKALDALRDDYRQTVPLPRMN